MEGSVTTSFPEAVILNPENSGSLNPDDSDSVGDCLQKTFQRTFLLYMKSLKKELWSHGIRLDGICSKLQLNPKHYRKTNLVVFVWPMKLLTIAYNVAREYFFACSVMRLHIAEQIYIA